MRHSKEDIYLHTKALLVKMFEIEEDQISAGSHLYDDLDIDSIDAVDLMVELKNYTGARIEQEDFREVRTMQDVVDTVSGILNAAPSAASDQITTPKSSVA